MRSSKSRSRSKTNRPRTLGNIINRVFDSSGPEGKVRGTPQQIIEKYQFLARDAQLSNDRVAAENFQQHAEHYTRLLAEANRELAAEQEARGPQQNNQNGQQSGQYNNQPNGNYGGQSNSQNGNQNGGQQNGGQQNGNQQNGNNRDRQGDNRDYRNDQPRNDQQRTDQPRNDQSRADQPRQDYRAENRGDQRSENRNESRNENRLENRPENRTENRNESRQENRSENRHETRPDVRSDYRADVRGEVPQPNLMAGLSDLADTDTGLVSTPEARPRADRTQPRVRNVPQPLPEIEQPVLIAPIVAPAAEPMITEPAPKKTRAPRKPKADAAGGDDQAAAE